MTLTVLRNSCTENGVTICGACCRQMNGRIPGKRGYTMPARLGEPCPLFVNETNACSVAYTSEWPDECRDMKAGSQPCHDAQRRAAA